MERPNGSRSPVAQQLLRLMKAGRPTAEPCVSELVSQDELLRWIRAAIEMQRQDELAAAQRRTAEVLGESAQASGKKRPSIDVFLGSSFSGRLGELAPKDEDKTLLEYLVRTTERIGGQEFGVKIPGFEGASWEVYWRFRSLVEPLASEHGLHRNHLNCFFGNYRRTLFGVHHDAHDAHVFQYCVLGHKVLRAWNPFDLHRDRGRAFLTAINADGRGAVAAMPETPEFGGGPGTLFYWPGNYFHYFESAEPSAGFGLMIEHSRPGLSSAVSEELRSPAHTPRTKQSWTRASAHMQLRSIAKRLSAAATEVSVASRDLAARSSLAADAVPDLLPLPELDDAQVLVPWAGLAPSILLRDCGRVIVVAVNGHTADWAQIAARQSLTKFCAFVRRSASIGVGAAAARFAAGAGFPPEAVRGLLAFFVAAGALRVVDPSL